MTKIELELKATFVCIRDFSPPSQDVHPTILSDVYSSQHRGKKEQVRETASLRILEASKEYPNQTSCAYSHTVSQIYNSSVDSDVQMSRPPRCINLDLSPYHDE